MKSAAIFATSLLLAQSTSDWTEHLAFWSRGELHRLKQRADAISAELATLPVPRMMHSSSQIGFQTTRIEEDDPPWVEVMLAEQTLIDRIALIPVLERGEGAPGTCYGFPLRHRLEVFDDSGGSRIVFESSADLPNPEGYPVQARFDPLPARRIRLTATKPWSNAGQSLMALSEIMVFSGTRNIASHATVSASNTRTKAPLWSPENLTDHITPLGLPAKPAEPVLKGYHSAISAVAPKIISLQITLPQTSNIDEITLYPLPRREVPAWVSYGFPSRFSVQVSAHADFSDPRMVLDHRTASIISPGENVLSIVLNKEPVRTIRIRTRFLWERTGDFLLALSEVQAIADGKNVALHAEVTASDQLDDPAYSPAALTDGSTNLGPLLPLPEWLDQLQHRQTLERELAALTTARQALLARSQDQLVHGSIGAGALILTTAITALLRQRRARKRDAERLRERLARDLHDEIGSNLGSIALISAFATQDDATPGTMRDDLIEVQRIARETADSMRDMVQLMSPRHSGEDSEWLTVLRSLATRLLRGTGITPDIQLQPTGPPPDIDTRRQLYLFCKEALHNAAKHSQAHTLRFSIETVNHRHRITISDDGLGFDPSNQSSGHGLSNLRERATTLHADLVIHSQPGQGTRITLTLPT